jgi:hypothetical protein
MKKVIFSILFVATIALLSSCSSDNSTNPTTNGKPLPLSQGNYWIYDNYSLDSTNTKVASSKTTDSVVIKQTFVEDVLTYKGVTVYESETTNSASQFPMTTRYYTNDNGIYQKFSSIPGFPSDLFGLKLGDLVNIGWILYIDTKNPSWVSLPEQSLTLDSLQIPQAGNIKLTLKFSMNGTKGTTKQFTINGKNFTGQGYVTSIKITGTVTLLDIPRLPPVPLSEINIPTTTYYVDGIGMVYSKSDSFKVSIGTFFNQTFEGTERTLIRYNVK